MTSKRWQILATACAALIGGVSLVSFGAQAAWRGYSENAGVAVQATIVQHNNRANPGGSPPGSTCTPATSPGACSPILPAPGGATFIAPSGTVTASVALTNTGGTATTMQLSSASAPTGAACVDLTLKVTDIATGAIVYSGAVTLGAPVSLPGTGGPAWAANEAHAYTVAITAVGRANHNQANCSFPSRWLQSLGGWTLSTSNANSIQEATRPNTLSLTSSAGTSVLAWSPQVGGSQNGFGCTYVPASQTRCDPLTTFQAFANYNGNTYTYNAALTPGSGYNVVVDIQTVLPQQTTDGTFDCTGTTGTWVCTAY